MNKKSGDIQQSFKMLVKQRRFAEIAKLIETSKTKPAEYIVRLGYKQYIDEPQGNRVKLFYIMKLKELTDISPDDMVLKEACELSLDMDSPEILETLIKRLDIKKDLFQLMDKTLQALFSKQVEEGKFVDLARISEITGIKPKDAIIQNGYEKYLDEGKFISFSGLKKKTGIPPDETLIYDMYGKYNFNYLQYKNTSSERAREWMDRLKKLKRISKIDPPEGITIEDDNEIEEEV